MKIAGLALSACLLLAPAVWGYEWPTTVPRLVSGFGQETDGRLAVGVDLVVAEPDVRPIERGDVVFRYDPARPTGSLPRGMGAHVVLQHAERVRSVYAHLEAGSVLTASAVSPGQSVGRVGETGAALGKVLGLSILDMETSTYLNPLVVLPPVSDTQAPVIGRVLLRRAEGESEIARTPFATTAGAAEVVVEAYDLREDVKYRWRIAPFTVSISVNGRQTDALRFDSIRSEGALVFEYGARRSADTLYAGPWLYRLGTIQLQKGETRLEILVRDFAGNESTKVLVLSIGG